MGFGVSGLGGELRKVGCNVEFLIALSWVYPNAKPETRRSS